MARKKLAPRAERRQRARAADQLGRARERLARLEPGGSPDAPVEVESASQVEPHAAATACLRCDGSNRLEEHAAVAVRGETLRVARMLCPRCGATREVWFRIATRLSS